MMCERLHNGNYIVKSKSRIVRQVPAYQPDGLHIIELETFPYERLNAIKEVSFGDLYSLTH